MKEIAEATRARRFRTHGPSKGLDSNMRTRCTDNCEQFGRTAKPSYDSIKWKDIKERGGWWYNIRDTPGKRARRVCPNCASKYGVKGEGRSLAQPIWTEVFHL